MGKEGEREREKREKEINKDKDEKKILKKTSNEKSVK
jgi:hypothetical protein